MLAILVIQGKLMLLCFIPHIQWMDCLLLRRRDWGTGVFSSGVMALANILTAWEAFLAGI